MRKAAWTRTGEDVNLTAENTENNTGWIYVETQKHELWEDENRIPNKWPAGNFRVCIEQVSSKHFLDRGKVTQL